MDRGFQQASGSAVDRLTVVDLCIQINRRQRKLGVIYAG